MADSKETQDEAKEESRSTAVSYPSETIENCIQLVRKIVEERGGGTLVTREHIALILGKALQTLQLRISTCVQYGLLVKNHGKGYSSSTLFHTIESPEYDQDKANALIDTFKNPPLYRKLVDRYNGKPLPSESGLINILVNEFKVNKNSAERAARVFYENCNYVKVIDSGNRLKVLPAVARDTSNGAPLPPAPPQEEQEEKLDRNNRSQGQKLPGGTETFSHPIPLHKGVAYLEYPLDLDAEDYELLDLYVTAILKGLKLKIRIPEKQKAKDKKSDDNKKRA